MTASSQKQVWNNIAEEWAEFKNEIPSERTLEFLKDKTGNILDLGSGSGRHMVKLPNSKFFLVDFSEKMISLAKKKAKKEKIPAEFFVSDLSKLPFEDNFFDCVICIAALHCLETKKERDQTIKELYRVLKPKAVAEIAVWNKNSFRFTKGPKEKLIKWRDKGSRYYYLYDADEIYKDFENVGFKIIKKLEPERNITFYVTK